MPPFADTVALADTTDRVAAAIGAGAALLIFVSVSVSESLYVTVDETSETALPQALD
jgi:hypothetical protein